MDPRMDITGVEDPIHHLDLVDTLPTITTDIILPLISMDITQLPTIITDSRYYFARPGEFEFTFVERTDKWQDYLRFLMFNYKLSINEYFGCTQLLDILCAILLLVNGCSTTTHLISSRMTTITTTVHTWYCINMRIMKLVALSWNSGLICLSPCCSFFTSICCSWL